MISPAFGRAVVRRPGIARPITRRAASTLTGEETRDDFAHIERIQTRWSDNDAFGHINNAVYYFYFDDAVNNHLGAFTDEVSGVQHPRFVAESGCRYLRPIAYPADVDVGLRLQRLGSSSIKYDIGIFAADEPGLAACGHFVHVYVDDDGRPKPIEPGVRAVLENLTVDK